MAEDINKKGMHNGFETLVKAIEELAGNKVESFFFEQER